MNLLIVDDEPVIRMGVLKMARTYSPAFDDIFTAENGADALQKIRDHQPAIIVTDIKMPKMDGLELCRILHEEYPHIQKVVLSGYHEFDYARKCIDYGVKNYLLKPVTRGDIHEMLDKILQQSDTGYMSISRYVHWIERMEQAIWSMDLDELAKLQNQWRNYCLKTFMSLDQLRDLLTDCLAFLIQRMQARSYEPHITFNDRPPAKHPVEELEQFEQQVQKIADDLLTARKGNFKDPIEEVRAFIENHLSQDISLEQMAEMAGLSPNYFSAIFKKATSETFVQYRIRRRMDRAKELLSLPQYRISDVAAEVGYEDYPHFTKTFKKIIGVSPSDYRQQLGIK